MERPVVQMSDQSLLLQGVVVVAEAGKTAYVPCTVYNLANHTVR